MNIYDINPYIRKASFSVLPAGYLLKRRIIFDYELIFVESGDFTLRYADKDYPCKAGDIILLRPDTPHSFIDITKDLSQPHIHFDMRYGADSETVPISFRDRPECTPKELGMIRKDIFGKYPDYPFLEFEDKKSFSKLFYKVLLTYKSSPLTAKATLTEIIDMIIRDNFPDCFTPVKTSYNVARLLKDYIDSGQGMALRLEDLEKEYSYNCHYLGKHFKKEYGISLMAYRNNKRMELAKKLLKTESVSSVAVTVGFKSIYSFSRAFKNHFGINPSEINNP